METYVLVRFSSVSFGLFRQIPGNTETDVQYQEVVVVDNEMHALEALRGKVQLMAEAINSANILEFADIQAQLA